MSQKNVAEMDERRRFFRIDDEINLFYKKVDPAAIRKYSEASNCQVSPRCTMIF